MMETYYGQVRTPADAIKLFEACRLGLLPRVQRRLSEKERQQIRSGSVFVWDEREAGMRRWTDGKSWSASRVSGSFLTYREMEGKRGNAFGASRRGAGKTPDSGRGSDDDHDDGEPDGYRYKPDGLMKQSFSITNSAGQHLHLIAYYSRGSPLDLPQPSMDPALRHIVPPKGMYPESSLTEAAPPAGTRSAMHQAPYPLHHHPPPPLHGYPLPYPPPGYGWPPSPAGTPPYSHGHYPYSQGPPHPPLHAYPPYPHHPYPPPPPHAHYDRTPLPLPQPHPQLPAPVLPKAAMPLPQGYPHSQHHSPRASQPGIPVRDSPRSQQLQAQARDAVQIDTRLAPIDTTRNQASALPVPGQITPFTSGTSQPPPPLNPATTSPETRSLSMSPPRSAVSSDGRSNDRIGTVPTASTKPVLSALLLHPPPSAAPTDSAPNSANPGSSGGIGSASSSPSGAQMGGGTPVVGPPAGQRERLAVEDARTIGVLNKNFF
ncbi:Gti1/Pac2 family-domain-containing protein [Chaetomium strumarium]|uniref:Gti1/Pac2 family-domain-containing protein n=1 Tax=Chaetomium strumarium TaxID=1170767 RepID=A0AAJ0GTE2_9PEZI|nr:Gti1/Pac2 family-domain-containing protein [Chaetomium strumarium]